mgnify:FL=1
MKHRKTAFIALLVFVFFSYTSSFLWAGEAANLLMTTVDKGLAVLKDPALKGNDKVQERRQKLWEEISFIFHFEEMAKRSLGVYWKDRSAEEKKGFVELFTEILKESYIGKTDTYSGEKVALVSDKMDGKYACVQTKLVTNKGTDVSVEYRMLNNQGEWKIYDVIIEGVSLVNNYRSQFNSILTKSSYADLVVRIKEKSNN